MREKVRDKVQDILERYPKTRDDDHILYFMFVKENYISKFNMPFDVAFLMHKEAKIPPYHSVARFRRELQNKFPELRADEIVKSARDEEEMQYHEYYSREKKYG